MLDLTNLFGEGWCVTLAQGPVSEVLARIGAVSVDLVPDGLDRATERLLAGGEERVLLLGREVAADWTLVVELEGTTGWVGMHPAVLQGLSYGGLMAVSACEDPNQVTVQVSRDGVVLGWVDAVTGRRFGEDFGTVGESLTAAGFPPPGADEPSGQAAGLEASQRAVLAMRKMTGVGLEEELFDGPWLGGLSAAL